MQRRQRRLSPRILNVGTVCPCRSPPGNRVLNTRLGGYQNRSEPFEVQQRHLPLPGIDRPAGRLVTTLTELSQQSHNVTVLKSTQHAGNVRFARVSNRKIQAPVLEVQIYVHSTAECRVRQKFGNMRLSVCYRLAGRSRSK
jgi:hypothetical protein